MGMFDDLIPSEQPTQTTENMFVDLIPKQTKKIDTTPEELNFGERLLSGITLPDWMQNLRGKSVYRVAQGMADPVVGAAQFVANLLPDSTGIPQSVNKNIANNEREYQFDRLALANKDKNLSSLITNKQVDPGFDAMRLAGNVASPANLAIAARAPLAATTVGRVAQGAGMGALGGALEPVNNTDNGYWDKKIGQVATGAAIGAAVGPALGAIADRAVRFIKGDVTKAPEELTDLAINKSLNESGQSIADISQDQLNALRAKVSESISGNKQIDPSALQRQADFEALGIKPTLGQLTRDPIQFAREQNLRGVEGVGEPLSARFSEQGNQLQAKLSSPANGALDAYNAGAKIAGSLENLDNNVLRPHVSALYADARASAGKDLELPLQGLAQDYAQILNDFGDKVPTAIRSKFSSLGLDPNLPSNQKKIFTIEDADKLLKNINDLDPGFSDRGTSNALARLRESIKNTVTSADATGGPFAPAVKAASERFKMIDAMPSLKAAAEGTVAPDDFINKFIINGKTDQVKKLSETLKQSDPAAWQEARAQMADTLKRAAFGENAAGDSPFSPARYMQQVRRLGVDKLGAFFNASEVDDILRVGRVGAYIKQAPNASAVNTSNTGSAVGNLFSRIPGAGPAISVVNKVAGTIQNNNTVKNALAANLGAIRQPMTKEQSNFLRYILNSGALGLGGNLSSLAIRQ